MATDTSTLPVNIGTTPLTDAERADLDANPKPTDTPIDPTTGVIDYSIPARAAGIYIPPEGIWFRLINYQYSHIMVSRYDPEPQVATYYINDTPVHDDQWFTLIHGTGSRNGLFLLRAKKTSLNLYSRNYDPWVWHVAGNGDYDDNWFTIEPGTGQWDKNFRLFPPATGLCIFTVAGNPARPNNTPSASSNTKYGDQYWNYIFEDMDVVKVEYDIDQLKIANQTPTTLLTATLTNVDSSSDQEMSFAVDEAVAETSEFSYSSGFTMTVGTEFSAGIPEIASVTASIEVSTSQTRTFGKSEEISKQWTATFFVHAKAGKNVEATAIVSKGTISVPYTITLKSRTNGVQTQMQGIWSGVSSWDIRCTTRDV